MIIVGSRACFFIAIIILLTAFTFRLINVFTKSNGIYIFYYKKFLDNKLSYVLLFLSFLLIPYYLVFNLFLTSILGEEITFI